MCDIEQYLALADLYKSSFIIVKILSSTSDYSLELRT
jgi:hypothetical protein